MSNLLKSNLAVAAGTALSRVTGVVRVAVLGAVLGSPGALADAYDLANGTPNMIYELLLGGVLSSTLVPLFTRLHDEGDDEGTSAVITVSVILTAAITLAAVVLAPLVFRMYSLLTAESVDAGQYREVGTVLARMFLVQIFFYGMNALASALLNARRRFFAAAWVPALANVVIIGSLLLVPGITDHKVPGLSDVLDDSTLRWVLGGGATLGIAVMALALLPACLAAGVRVRFRPQFRHPAVQELRRLSGWALGYVVANQVAVIVIRNLLRGGDGSVFAYSRAYMWFVLPHGLLAMSIATTFLPEMTSAITRKDKPGLIRHSSLGIRLIALVTMPAGFGLFVLRRPIIGAAFQHGNVTAADALATSRALAGFALGLVGFSVYLFVLRVFYAHHDARTPFVINVVENAINIALALVLVDRYGLLGLGAAFGIAYLLSALWSMQVLSYKVPGFPLRPLLAALYRMALASAVMAEVVWLAARVVGGNSGTPAIVRIVVAGLVGVVAYVGTLLVLKAPELDELRRKFRPAAPPPVAR
ncbi:MAG: murein biosynthesis integral membrane protein MurJ [Actinomycetota bacterium]|nr:murein biosynthesis integral membrane protein MurJ [Actinomycetota bacterium]